MDPTPPPSAGFSSVYHTDSHHHFHPHHGSLPPPRINQSTSPSPGLPLKRVPPALPQVGQTRCYWALLTTSLQFTVLDPVLQYHLQEQASSILDYGLLDFVHPDERESARTDLGNVLAERALHGSVTRVRYCRLSRVRRLLGWSDNSQPYPSNFPADRIAVDADYMAVYLVVNCVADGIVLCFIHAVVDIAPHADNDELRKTGWSNWCSTYGFDQEQAHALYQRLCEIALPITRSAADPSLHVLQILRNQADRTLVVSWPPDSTLLQDGYLVPVASSLAQLTHHVQLGYFGSNGDSDDPRTSCTRRFKSVQTVKLPAVTGPKTVQVETILIPHGSIIFACHKICDAYLDAPPTYSPSSSNPNSQYPDVDRREATSTEPQDYHVTTHQDPASRNYVQQWVSQQLQTQVQQDSCHWANSASIPPTSGSCITYTDVKYNHLDTRPYPQEQWQEPYRTLGNNDLVSAVTSSGIQTSSTSKCETPSTMPPSTTSSSSHKLYAINGETRNLPCDVDALIGPSKIRSAKERISAYGRGQGNPPLGVTCCAHCQITHSPEWRKGPSGKKDLCNACGLRFSRSKAKTEGIVSRRRKNKEGENHPLSKTSRAQPHTSATGARGIFPQGGRERLAEAPPTQSSVAAENRDTSDWPAIGPGIDVISTPDFQPMRNNDQMPPYLSQQV